MKKMIALFLGLSMSFALSACGGQNSGNPAADNRDGRESAGTSEERVADASTEAPGEASVEEPETTGGKTLVVYFSATGNTEIVADYIAAATGAELFELVPAEPYSEEDLNWTDNNSRVSYEYENPDERAVELVEATVSDWESYDTVFIGYPIWWRMAAWPVDSFIAANDFTGKAVKYDFCFCAII